MRGDDERAMNPISSVRVPAKLPRVDPPSMPGDGEGGCGGEGGGECVMIGSESKDEGDNDDEGGHGGEGGAQGEVGGGG